MLPPHALPFARSTACRLTPHTFYEIQRAGVLGICPANTRTDRWQKCMSAQAGCDVRMAAIGRMSLVHMVLQAAGSALPAQPSLAYGWMRHLRPLRTLWSATRPASS
jgi:hypothetical protein